MVAEPWQDPDVRAKVLSTATPDEARRAVRGTTGKVWCDELLHLFVCGLAERLDDGTELGARDAQGLRDGASEVTAPGFADRAVAQADLRS